MSVPISIMFATAERPQLVRRTLKSLIGVEKPDRFQGIWVVENGNPTGVESIVQEFSSSLPVHYLYCDQAIKTAALNHGLAHLPESLVYLTDDDVRFYPGTLVALAAGAASAPRASYFGGPFDVDYETSPPAWLTPWLPFSARGWSRPHDQPTHLPRGRFLGFNWAAYRDDMNRIEGFDISTGPGSTANGTGDETEIQTRLRQHGVESWYLPQMRLAHYVPESRCSSEWTIERAYRQGLGWGQNRRQSTIRPFLKIKAYGRWQLARSSLAIRRKLATHSDRTTMARVNESKWRGRYDGLRRGAA